MEREIRLLRADGEYFWFLHRIVPFRDESGNVLKWIATVTDIHALKQSEQELQQQQQALRRSEAYLAEAQRLSQTGSWAWNPATGDISYWSEECYRVLGFDPAGPPPRFETFLQRLHPDDQAHMRERSEKAIRDKADFELDHRIVHPDKGVRDIHVAGHPVFDDAATYVNSWAP
jgi:PAS domain-containing protein